MFKAFHNKDTIFEEEVTHLAIQSVQIIFLNNDNSFKYKLNTRHSTSKVVPAIKKNIDKAIYESCTVPPSIQTEEVCGCRQ